MTNKENLNQYVIDLGSNKKNIIHKIINDELNFKGFDYWKEFKISFSFEREDIFQELLSAAIRSSEKFKNNLNVKLETFLDRSMRNYLKDLKQKVKIKYENNFINIELNEENVNKHYENNYFYNETFSVDFETIFSSLSISKEEKYFLKKLIDNNDLEAIKKRFIYQKKLRNIKQLLREKV